MSFVQNFPLFTIILSLVCAVISFAANDRWARGLTLFLLSVSVCMQAALLVFCAVNGTSYSYMMGHYPAPWGNEITVGVLESFMALLFAAVMLMSVLGGMPRIRRISRSTGCGFTGDDRSGPRGPAGPVLHQ